MQGAILMCLTSSITPTLMPSSGSTFEQHDWAHIYPSKNPVEAEELAQMNRDFQLKLGSLADELDAYNDAAPHRPFPDNTGIWTANPRYMETSVSI
mmetsp:Transcript_4065/g.12977  ORF Transcript_4065/g.12977 Transcript_4065/m.12977 type:complete len:96 (-) Transcript_4065:210-497(-)